MSIEVEGTQQLRDAAQSIRELFSPQALTLLAIEIAAEAGKKLKEDVVQKCVDEIYEMSGMAAPFSPRTLPGLSAALGGDYGGLPADRTEALIRAHEVVDEGLTQIVRIDPSAEAEPTQHSGRETVLDYAIPVHEGYTQWVMGKDMGVHHMGRPWFYDALVEHGEDVCMFVVRAFEERINQLWAAL